MRIVSVLLDNVKSYEWSRVDFRYGTNAICGRNGAGKSTILEAIGFVLFDHLAVKQDDFVRKGENTAKVTVTVAADDSREYEIVRSCGSKSEYHVRDLELGQELTNGKAETMVWLQDFLGMEANADLATLFRDAVGVPQGLLTAAFLETPSRRKDVFNPLLRVDEYEQVWSKLREPGRWLELRITEQEKTIAGLQGQVAALPEALRRAETLSTEIEDAERQRHEQEAALEAVTTRIEALDAAKARLDSVNQAVAQAELEVEALRHRQADVAKSLTEAKAARDVVDETREGFDLYEATQRTLEALESKRAERDQLQEELRGVEKELALNAQRFEDLVAELETIEAAQSRMTELEPEVERQDDLEEALDAARLQMDRLESARRSLEREAQRLTQMRAQMETMAEDVQKREAVEGELSDLRETLAEVEADREDLATAVASKEAELARLSSDLDAAATRLEDLQAALARGEPSLAALRERASEVRAGLKAREEAEQTLAAQRQALETLTAEVEAITVDQAGERTTLEQTEARIAALKTGAEQESACPVCGQALTPEHRDTLLNRYQDEAARCQAALRELKRKRGALAQQRREVSDKVRELEADLQTLPRPDEAEAIAERVAAQEEELGALRGSVEEARTMRSQVAAQVDETEVVLEDLRDTLDAKTQRQSSLRDDVRAQEARLDALPRSAELDQLQARIEAQISTVESQNETVANLSSAPEEAESLQAQLTSLGNPRRDYQRASDLAETYPDVVKARKETEAQQETLQSDLATLEASLEAYADLDARLATERATLVQHEDDHRRYVAHLREAEALDGYQETYEQVESELSKARADLETILEDREEAREAYNSEAHTEARDKRGDLREALAALKERMHQHRARLSETETEITRLQTLASELAQATSERDSLTTLQDLLGYLRGVLREAGPLITRRLVDVISLRADRLYREIMQDYTARLRWTEDYDVILKQNGRERTFQQLSGGEQMAAALAVRLALLQEVSTVDVAFFDEPTANLDDQRRDNLAEQILGIKGFNQLFVISHDDTFEQDTDHVVRVRKVDGVSQVEV